MKNEVILDIAVTHQMFGGAYVVNIIKAPEEVRFEIEKNAVADLDELFWHNDLAPPEEKGVYRFVGEAEIVDAEEGEIVYTGEFHPCDVTVRECPASKTLKQRT